ncbi:MAG: T9SS type A sorting domain-containing protein [bacterium]
MRNKGLSLCILLVLGMGSLTMAKERPAGERKDRQQSLSKITGEPRWQILNINNFTTWARNDGQSNHTPRAIDGGLFPRGTRTLIYQDGLMWGGKCYVDAALTIPAPNSQLIRVGGANYVVGSREGWIIGQGATAVAADPADSRARAFRIRRDYFFMSDGEVQRDAAESNEILEASVTAAQMQTIRSRYDLDWREWPVDLGAPYIERNGTAGYQPPPSFSDTFTPDHLISGNYDEPGLAGADPNSPADQVIWLAYNDLDANQTLALEGSEPMGLEVQVTLWGYKRTDALGNIYFKRYKFTNKGGIAVDAAGTKGAFYINEMYTCQWSDPDLGNAGDDILGNDSTFSVGYVYNANGIDSEYNKFRLPPPCAGYDFLQGPAVPSPGDSAVFDLKIVYDKKNLGMTSFTYFSAGSPFSDPTGSYSTSTLRWYKLMRGFAPTDGEDQYYPVPPGFSPTKYPLSGDPIKQIGFLDGEGTQYSFPPGDRRLLCNTGPFSLSPGETQEVVVATIGGLGADRLSSVAVMLFNDQFAQNTYNALFQVAKPPTAPAVSVNNLDREVVIEWGSNLARVADTENKLNNPGGYKFEGYNVYQFPIRGGGLADAVRIATYDLTTDPSVVLNTVVDIESGQVLSIPVQFGSNSGIRRVFNFTRDYVRDIDALYNGQDYFLGVTAYSVTTIPGFLPSFLESEAQVIVVTPQKPFGTVYQQDGSAIALGDTLRNVSHTGPSDGAAYPLVVNSSVLNGHDYKIVFKDDGTGTGATIWDLIDVTANNRVVLANVANQSGDDQYAFTDGFQLRIVGAPNSFKFIQTVANAAGPIDPPTNGSFSFNNSGFPTPDGGPVIAPPNPGANDRPLNQQSTNASTWGVHTADNGSRASFDAFLVRTSNNGGNWAHIIPYDWEIRFTAAGGYAYDAFGTSNKVIQVPFELWRTGIATPNDASDDVRWVPYMLDDDLSGTYNLCATHPNAGANDHSISGGDNDPYTDWVYWATPADLTPGDAGYRAWEAAALAIPGGADDGSFYNVLATDNTLRRTVLVNFNGGSVSDPTFPANLNAALPETGTVFRLTTTKPNTPIDSFTFKSPAPTVTQDLQASSFKTINVYPNPYYAFNPAEETTLSRYVTFNNLPPTATIRIFNLAGQLVRTLEKTDDPVQFMQWNLQNQIGLPVASGMYIAYIEGVLTASGEKVSKVLKLAVIQEQEVLDVF